MKQLITYLSSVVFALGLSVARATPAEDHHPNASRHNKAALPQVVEYLFVVSADKGHLKQVSKGQYELEMAAADLNQVIMFSNRPQRIVKYLSRQELSKIWRQGDNSFEKNPPNAVLSTEHSLSHIVVITGLKTTKDRMVVRFSSEQPIAISGEIDHKLTLSIDDYFFTPTHQMVFYNIPGCTAKTTAGFWTLFGITLGAYGAACSVG